MTENKEMLAIVDENDSVVGLETRTKVHEEGLLHREIHIWFITPNAEIVFQHRAKDKKMKGWHKLSIKLLAYFNSDLKKKVVVYNTDDGIIRKLVGLLREYWEETKQLKIVREY